MKILQGLPEFIASDIHLNAQEVAYYLYMPISVPGQGLLALPPQLEPYEPLINIVMLDEPMRFKEEYAYITIKRMIVGPGISVNRPGWHADGFGTDDLNYVWSDSVPTVFSTSRFEVDDDHIRSLEQFEEQAREQDNFTFPNNSLLKLTSQNVHRVNVANREHMRTFVKISISKNKFNLAGNSRNYAAPGLDWKMYNRSAVRNDPHRAQADHYNPPDDHLA